MNFKRPPTRKKPPAHIAQGGEPSADGGAPGAEAAAFQEPAQSRPAAPGFGDDVMVDGPRKAIGKRVKEWAGRRSPGVRAAIVVVFILAPLLSVGFLVHRNWEARQITSRKYRHGSSRWRRFAVAWRPLPPVLR